jgi:flagellar motor switch protein FliN/FliY
MPDEQKDESQLADEMLRLMAQEAGGEESLKPSNDVEAAMLQMLQEAGPSGGAAAEDPSQKALDGMMEAGGQSALPDMGAALPPPPMSAPSPAFGSALGIPPENVSRLLDVRLTVSIELGRVQIPIRDIIGWTEGSLVEIEKVAGEPVDVLVNEKLFARGEVVVIAENFGVRITQMVRATN